MLSSVAATVWLVSLVIAGAWIADHGLRLGLAILRLTTARRRDLMPNRAVGLRWGDSPCV